MTATVAELGRRAAEFEVARHRLIDRLVAATGQSAARLAHELDNGDVYDAPAALALGLIERIELSSNGIR